MEQKQLDEIDESYFGEEFIDEDVEMKDEPKKSTKIKSKSESKKATKTAKDVKEEVVISPAKEVEKVDVVEEHPKEEKVESLPTEEKPEENKPETPTETPVDPWADEDQEDGLFKEVSTWKAISGIVVILLIFSVFTQGFQFSETTSGGSADALSVSEAETKVLNFVNTNLLQPPFVAELQGSEDAGDLFKVQLEVAGQQVESYITKNGQLFFPQGFDITVPFDDGLPEVVPEEVDFQEPADEVVVPVEIVEEPTDVMERTEEPEAEDVAEEEEVVEVLLEEEPVELPAEGPTSVAGSVNQVSITSKKWSFTPSSITVNAGDTVKLEITPDGSNPAFSLPKYTFAVPDLNVEQEVDGSTTLEFTADSAGTYEFACSSCESWRGMSGTLVVK